MKSLLVLTIISVKLSLIGIDVGSKYIRVGLEENPQGDKIVENEISKRKTDNKIAICSEAVYIGESAVQRIQREQCIYVEGIGFNKLTWTNN